ncbi:MAG TPA: toll/interleukin-1 receptor domain-containing protein [Bacteroidia bacterium]|nr:toll/interleukin-1 receptor domain-containing protein [Bacteroidia bacterium]
MQLSHHFILQCTRPYDVFISYAVEDKNPVASAIVSALEQRGLRIYFVSDKLAPGVSVLDTVYEGLENSKYCIPVLSRNCNRTWPAIERNLILRREKKLNKPLIFPVRHGITPGEASELFPELHDHYAESTEQGLDTVIENLYNRIRKRKKEDRATCWQQIAVVSSFFILVAVVLLQTITPSRPDLPSAQTIEDLITQRVIEFHQYTEHQLAQNQVNPVKTLIPLDSIKSVYNMYDTMREYERNNYSFTNGWEEISGRSNIEQQVFSLPDSPHSAYGIASACNWLLEMDTKNSVFRISVAFTDTVNASHHVDSVFFTNDNVHVWVSYSHYIRVVFYSLTYSPIDDTRRQSVHILSFKPKEEYILNNSTGTWRLQEVK